MFNVIVVEDETPILNHTVRKLETLGLPLHVVGTASDGAQALALVRKQEPQLVITDIRMPGLDGLSLCRTLAKEFPTIKKVVLSGYGEFEYAQKCIQYGVSDYLLKPVNTQQLLQTMQALCDTLRTERETAQLREILRSLSGASTDAPPSAFADQPLRLCKLCLGNLQENSPVPVDSVYCAALWKQADLEDFLAHALPADAHFWLVPEKQMNEQVLVCTAFSDTLFEDLFEYTKMRLAGMSSVTLCCTAQSVHYLEIRETARQLRQTLQESLVPGVSSLLVQNALPHSSAQAEESLALVLREIKNGQTAHYRTFLRAHIALLLESHAPQQMLERHLVEVTRYIARRVSQFDVRTACDAMYARIGAATTGAGTSALQSALYAWADSMLAEALPACDTGEKLAASVRRYIDENYHEDISIETLAELFHFSESYISRVFRKGYGMPPMRYLLQQRIEKAKQLMLASPEINIARIAEAVGYDDSHYFSRIFKGMVGQSPSEFRQKAEAACSSKMP